MEGTLLKQSESRTLGKKWVKRLFRQTDPAKPYLYYFDKNTQQKGYIDMSQITAINTIEGHVTLGKGEKYFPFEIRLEGKISSYRLAAPTRNDLEYWMKGLRDISKKYGTAVQESMFTVMTNVMKTANGITPPLFPGEEIVNVLPFVHLEDKSVVMCFLTNFKIHLMRPRPTENANKAVHLPESQTKKLTKHSVALTAIYKADRVDEKDMLGLELSCRDLRKINIKFDAHQQQSTGSDPRNQILHHLSLFTPEKRENIFAYQHYIACVQEKNGAVSEALNAHGYYRYSHHAEFRRMGLPNATWRISDFVNRDYSLIGSYPAVLCVPERFDDAFIRKVSKFRTRCRIPALSWIHPVNNAVLLRCSQPRRGVTGATNTYDEEYLEFLSTQGSNPGRLWVYDARSETAAIGNKAIGGGFEEGYRNCKVVFCDVENIHAVRGSWKSLIKLCTEPGDDLMWYTKLQECGWFVLLYRILLASLRVVTSIMNGESCLVHCSDGWDRTSQMTAIAMLLLDPFYRSFEGFQTLIEKEWLSFGHQFSLRNGIETMAGDTSSEESPIFLQFLECVAYLRSAYPTAFEFNEDLLVAIFDNLYSCAFGTFLYNSEKERISKQVPTSTVSFWAYVEQNREYYVNNWYTPVTDVLVPNIGIGHLQLWRRLWFRWDPIEMKARSGKDKRTRNIKEEFKSLGGNIADLVKSNSSSVSQIKFATKYAQDINQALNPTPEPSRTTWASTNPFIRSNIMDSDSQRITISESENDLNADGEDIDGDAVEMRMVRKISMMKERDKGASEEAAARARIRASQSSQDTQIIDRIRKRKITQCAAMNIPREEQEIDMTDAAELLEAGGLNNDMPTSASSSTSDDDLAVSYSSSDDDNYIKFPIHMLGPVDSPVEERRSVPASDRPRAWPPSALEKRTTQDGETPTRSWPPIAAEKRATQDGETPTRSWPPERSDGARAWPPTRTGSSAQMNVTVSTPPIPEVSIQNLEISPTTSPTTSPRKPQPPIPAKKTNPFVTPAKKPLPLSPREWAPPSNTSPALQLLFQQVGPPPVEAVPRPTRR